MKLFVLTFLFFLILMNDIDMRLRSNIDKFADDTSIGRINKTDEDAKELQKDLNRFCEWSI